MRKFKKPALFALALLPIAILGGIFTGIYELEALSADAVDLLIEQLGSRETVIAVIAVQTMAYTLICGFFGYILANKVGLWKPIRIEKGNFLIALVAGVVCGLLFAQDYWSFGAVIPQVKASYDAGISASNVLASVLYGGVVEEVMLRLFFMSLLAILLWKVFGRKHDREHIPTGIFVAANVIAALLFATGHLPATLLTFGELTPLILFRCFLLNGCLGLVFGWLYRKYGIVYAMTGHALTHIVSKLIWFIFI